MDEGSSSERDSNTFYRLRYLLMDWMCDVRGKKEVKDDSKVSGLNNYKNGVASYQDKTTEESGWFFVACFYFVFV